ncbi:hypothetical protein CLW00_10352 [Mongoliibacter ruber]|uniref:Uncharacterized protein n=1 Tax=Mongoliibacter ruber TaxID=1750599 RepID=A0A2T0WQG0_9BACT|nr:hypothetical protein CLW00_10352 [Mongoliibacter ruber]
MQIHYDNGCANRMLKEFCVRLTDLCHGFVLIYHIMSLETRKVCHDEFVKFGIY